MSKVRKLVTYSVKFTAVVEFDPETEDEQAAVSDIDIPEGGANNSTYVPDSFKVDAHV